MGYGDLSRRRSPEHDDLTGWLHAEMVGAGMTYARLARVIGYDRAWLSRALRGQRLAAWPLVERVARGCGADVATARRLWELAEAAARVRRAHEIAGYPPPNLDDLDALGSALRELWHRRGLSQREITRRDTTGVLRRSTVGAVLRGSRTASRAATVALVGACGVDADVVHAWRAEWDRLYRARQQERARARRQRYREAERRYGRSWFDRTIRQR